eukprot:3007005-Rhodomonas_salina.1
MPWYAMPYAAITAYAMSGTEIAYAAAGDYGITELAVCCYRLRCDVRTARAYAAAGVFAVETLRSAEE